MKKLYYEDIICAKATAAGTAAIAVIRVSGAECLSILDKIFRRKSKAPLQPHRVYYGDIVDAQNVIDNVVVLPFADGKSFTGEESFEIQCHGSPIVCEMILQLLIKCGARPAEPGEFSKRAFLNGKIDLSQAEAIMDIVNSSTKQAALIASRQLNGIVSANIAQIKEQLTDSLAKIEVLIDYPEEDLSADIDSAAAEIAAITDEIKALCSDFDRGRYYREGSTAVLLGKTNSGKSTIFNMLLNEDKAIVSDIHGTTRDSLDGVINIGGCGVRLYDTAGLRMTDDPIEREGTRRAVDLAKKCDVVLYVIDGTSDFAENEHNLAGLGDKKTIFIINKTDAPGFRSDTKARLQNAIKQSNYDICEISARNRSGVETFNKAFYKMLVGETHSDGDPIITNVRHAALLTQALHNLENAYTPLHDGLLDLASYELREALDKIGDITGSVTKEDVINRIFEKFCVGK